MRTLPLGLLFDAFYWVYIVGHERLVSSKTVPSRETGNVTVYQQRWEKYSRNMRLNVQMPSSSSYLGVLMLVLRTAPAVVRCSQPRKRVR